MPSSNFRISYTSSDFPHPSIARRGDLETNWDELLWAAVTVGRPNILYVFAHGDASYYEAVFRLSLIRMALEERFYDGRLHRTDTLRSLDPTEKGAVSYFLGMAVCKLFAERLLRTTWLLHLDVFRNQLDPVVLGPRSRPDLVGMDDSGAWHAFECKGRSSIPSAEDRRKAKMQAQRLVRVDSTDCSLHVGAISYFRKHRLEFHWRDPEPREDEKMAALEVNVPDEAWGYYYAPALALHNLDESVLTSEARAALDVDIEIHPQVREPLLVGDWAAARLVAQGLDSELRDGGFRRDGLKVTAGDSWRRQREAGGIGL